MKNAQHHEMLQKPVLEKLSIRLEELENSGLLRRWAQRSYHSKLWAHTKGYRVFIHGQAWLSGFAGARVIANGRTRVSETSRILHSRRGRVLPFQLSVGLALSYSAKPPLPGNLVGPVRPLKIWLLSQCRLWSPWIMYNVYNVCNVYNVYRRWLMKQFLLFPYLSQP